MTSRILLLVVVLVSMALPNVVLAQELIRDINTSPNEFLQLRRIMKGGSTTIFSGDLRGLREMLMATPHFLPGRMDFEDLNRGDAKTFQPGDLLVHGNMLFFTAVSDADGRELWMSDGTRRGTVRVQRQPGGILAGLASLGRFVFFYAEGGHSLWKTDGTLAGTVQVAKLDSPIFGKYFDRTALVSTDDQVIFGLGGALGSELWRSDGTEAGTFHVGNETLGDLNYLSPLVPVGVPVGRLVYYSRGSRVLRSHDFLEVTDGTTNGTQGVGQFLVSSGGLDGPSFTPLKGRLVFAGSGSTNGMELWSSAGTTNSTVLLRDIWPGTNGSSPAMLTATPDAVYFVAKTPEHGREIWRTDGTTEGTRLLADLVEGPGEPNVHDFTAFGNSVYFIRYFDSSNNELWRANAGGLVRISQLPPDSIYELYAGHDALYVVGDPSAPLSPTWVGVVRESSPTVFEFLGPIPISTQSSSPFNLTVVRDLLFFTIDSSSRQLWRSDGSRSGTRHVATLGSDDLQSIERLSGTDSLVFALLGGFGAPSEFWVSDGTREGTMEVGHGSLKAESIQLHSAFHVGRRLCFPVEGERTLSLWSSDGTEGGTGLITDAVPVGFGGIIGRIGGGVVYEGTTNNGGSHGLYFTDGTAAGSRLLRAFSSSFETASDSAESGASLGGYLYFMAGGETDPHGLWRTDGSRAGTTLVKSVGSGGYWTGILRAGSKLYFEADLALPGGDFGYETWVSDGTSAGTRVIEPSLPLLWPLFAHSAKMLCSLHEGTAEDFLEIWSTDGSPGGTVRLGRLPEESKSASLVLVDGDLFVEVETHGATRWWRTTGGVGSGPLKWREAFDPEVSDIGLPHAVGSMLLFSAKTDRFGNEIYGMPRRRPPGRIERGGDWISVQFSELDGFRYRLDEAEKLDGPWTTETPAQEAQNGTAAFRRPVPSGDRYYRLVEE